MDGVKIGGIFYGMDIQKAMAKAHKIVMDSAKKVYGHDEVIIRTAEVVLDCYETALLERLKNDNGSE